METANVTPEQLEEATQQYKKVSSLQSLEATYSSLLDTSLYSDAVALLQALELRDSDPEAAIELLGKVLETRNKAYGEKAFECAEVYLHYGELLFEQAQVRARQACSQLMQLLLCCVLHTQHALHACMASRSQQQGAT
jgi:hypothetical protein